MTKKLFFLTLFTIILFAFMACPPPEPPPQPLTDLDCSKIEADAGTVGTGGLVIYGAEGATEPGATVTVSDGKGNTATGTAAEDGSFFVPAGNLDYTKGEDVTVTAEKPPHRPNSCNVTVN